MIRRLILLGCAALVPVGLIAWQALQRQSEAVAVARILTRGEPSRAAPLLIRYGCAGCHTIPGVPGADGQVGAPLGGLRARVYIAGRLPNTADNLVHWIVDPQAIAPGTAMPKSGISESEARDVAAWLYAN